MSRHVIALSRNGREVYFYITQAPIAQSVARNPHLLTLIKEAVANIDLLESESVLEQDMGRPIGYSETVETREKDTIFYACQLRSEVYTRFVKNRRTDHTSFLTCKLQQDKDGNYEVQDTWLGRAFPPVPTGADATEESRAYWETHAVVYNGQPIISSTITKECPY